MPALKKVALPTAFSELHAEGRSVGEQNDCTVKAMALTTGLSYATCRDALAAQGRKTGRGTFIQQQEAAFNALGFRLIQWSAGDMCKMVASYPKAGIAGITTHQPRRFPKAWAKVADRKLLMYSRGHVSAFVEGEVKDWAINRSKQVYAIYEVVDARRLSDR